MCIRGDFQDFCHKQYFNVLFHYNLFFIYFCGDIVAVD